MRSTKEQRLFIAGLDPYYRDKLEDVEFIAWLVFGVIVLSGVIICGALLAGCGTPGITSAGGAL